MSKPIRVALVVVVLLAGYWMQSQEEQGGNNQETATTESQRDQANTSKPEDSRQSSNNSNIKSKASPALQENSGTTVRDLFRAKTSDRVVEVEGVVKFTLPDDNDGSRHQQFVLVFDNGHTVKVAHNIDLAPYVPLKKGDVIKMRGEYEWSAKGGVIHWTHHDPGGRRPGGWIILNGKTYK